MREREGVRGWHGCMVGSTMSCSNTLASLHATRLVRWSNIAGCQLLGDSSAADTSAMGNTTHHPPLRGHRMANTGMGRIQSK